MIDQKTSRHSLLISFVIAGMLGLQAFAVIDPLVTRWFRENGYFWPFVDYPMYREPGMLSEHLDQLVVVGTLSDGTERRIQPSDLGLSPVQYRTGFIEALIHHKLGAIRTYLQAYHPAPPNEFIRMRLEKTERSLGTPGGHSGARAVYVVTLRERPRS